MQWPKAARSIGALISLGIIAHTHRKNLYGPDDSGFRILAIIILVFNSYAVQVSFGFEEPWLLDFMDRSSE
ncbi:hypothetical protein Csa_003815 [Cucumis sativus]|uniref:Uncharacterized protein n=1 Tax=Cucumis sativus TaxID=3659 RepID=A0A0A0KGY9_CUCSA|nr:hypothetical protein Csa_003815 [Cucumis sativus]